MHKQKKQLSLTRPVAFMGMPGCGKSTIGNLFATEIGLPFVDSDQLIERKAGQTIPEIFSQKGEPYFRDVEKTVIKEKVGQGGPFILSIGGGAIMTKDVQDCLNEYTTLIFVDAPLDILWERLSNDPVKRPLLKVKNPQDKLAALYKERLPVYSEAHIILKNTETPDMAVRELMNILCS